jgi:hypothetical protein
VASKLAYYRHTNISNDPGDSCCNLADPVLPQQIPFRKVTSLHLQETYKITVKHDVHLRGILRKSVQPEKDRP